MTADDADIAARVLLDFLRSYDPAVGTRTRD
jgi:hypothetical protein